MPTLLEAVEVGLDQIYVPARLRAGLDAKKVESIAESIIVNGLQTPIQVRRDKERYVLVAGLHRLEAVRALGEAVVRAYIVRAPQH